MSVICNPGPLFLTRRPNVGVLGQWLNRSGCVRFPFHQPLQVRFAARHLCASTARNACTRYATDRTRLADRAKGYLCERSTAPLRETIDCRVLFVLGRLPCPTRLLQPSSIHRHLADIFSLEMDDHAPLFAMQQIPKNLLIYTWHYI